MASQATTTVVQLDRNKLSAITEEPQQQLFILSFLTELEALIDQLDADGASSHQLYVQKELLQVLQLSATAPTRLIRSIAGRCFASVFRKGDSKLLHDTINELLGLINAGKEKDVRIKHAAIHCLGDIFAAVGGGALSVIAFAATSILKLFKAAHAHCGLRRSALAALGHLFKAAGPALDESIARDIWKCTRTTAQADKSSVVQIAALQCLEVLFTNTGLFMAYQEYEKLYNTCMKAFESSYAAVRKEAASCLASALGQAYISEPKEALNKNTKKPKKGKRQSAVGADDESIDSERPASPAPQKRGLVKLGLSLEEILQQLSAPYVKPTTSARVRAGLALTYIQIMLHFGSAFVSSNYRVIAKHLLVDILGNTSISSNRFRLLMARKHVRIIMVNVIGRTLLAEAGQIDALRALLNDVVKNYPQLIKERPAPSKNTLTGTLQVIGTLISDLGPSVSSVQDLIREALLQVLQHPSYTVQLSACWCLRAFVVAAPSQLLPVLTICMNNVSRELTQLTARRPSSNENFRRCTGYANGLAAAVSCVLGQPIYSSVDITSRVLSLATSLLKSSGDFDLRISSTQVQVAWILIGGLMSLGPNFVKIHLSQLLLLWKNALPKPLAKDATSERSFLELSFLSHVRECALGSILSFLEFNHRLLTADVSKRIASMLHNSTLFLNSLPVRKTTDDSSQLLSPSLHLLDFDLMVRRRVLQCYVKLVKLSHPESLQPNLLTLATTLFADPEKFTPSSLSTAIANSAGNYESLWDVADNYAYGVTSLVKGYDIYEFTFEAFSNGRLRRHWMSKNSPSSTINFTPHDPIIGSLEHDSVLLYLSDARSDTPTAAPPATAVVDSAIELFTALLPLQPPKIQESILEQIATFLSSPSLSRDPGRKAAMMVNVAVSLLGVLRLTVENKSVSASLSTPSVLKSMAEMLQQFVLLSDSYVRSIAFESLGLLCSIGGNTFTGNMINWLVDTIVQNRDPNARAGCAVALGCIHSHVGGMAAGFHLKTIISILLSLSTDPHPTVHFWALDGLSRTIDSAGLTFSAYVTSTLGMLSQLYVGDTHHEEVTSIASSNLAAELPTLAIIARCIDSLIGVLGPDLQDAVKVRGVIMTTVGQLRHEPSSDVQVETLRCLEHLSMFASSHIDIRDYVWRLQRELRSDCTRLREAAVDGFYQLMKIDADRVLKLTESDFEEALWRILDESPSQRGVRNIFRNWLSQTGMQDPVAWIDRCQAVMSKLVEKRKSLLVPVTVAKASATDLNDEEVAGMAENEKDARPIGRDPLRWQVRTFAAQLLQELLQLSSQALATQTGSDLEDKLVGKVGDIVKMAFSASTSNVVVLRLAGLRIIELVLKVFGHTPDPDFADAPLLEQYQAQIGSALTPAFAVDSSPELAAEAVNVCAGFIAVGIVKDVDRMGRILKLLVSALIGFSSDSDNASIGELKDLSSNAQVMVKMAVLRAWAELQVASNKQAYLGEVVKPHIPTLAPMWLVSLREFARLRFEPDVSSNASNAPLGGGIDSIYSTLNREVLLGFYQDSWLKLVDAIASLIERDSQFIFDALDGKAVSGDPKVSQALSMDEINYRDEPVAFFFVLFGIAFEALVGGRSGTSDRLASKEQTLEILLALKKILRPSVCGQAIYQEVVFSEAMDLLDRLVLTEGLAVQLAIIDIVRGLCLEHPAARRKPENTTAIDIGLSDDIDQLFELTRLIVLVLAGTLPSLVDSQKFVKQQLSEDAVNLICLSLDALVDAAEVFPVVIRMDLYASILHIFTTILGIQACQTSVIPSSLPTLKRFLRIITTNPSQEDNELVVSMVRSCLGNILQVLDHAKLRGEAGIPCVRNTLMAAAVILTAGNNLLPPNDQQLARFIDHVLDSLADPLTYAIAAQCCKMLLLRPSVSIADQEITRKFLPRLMILSLNDNQGEGSFVVPALRGFLRQFSGEQLQTGESLFIPFWLERARRHSDARIKRQSAESIYELAELDMNTFRAVVTSLSVDQKALLEELLKTVYSVPAGIASGKASSQPSIELKMNFS